MKDIRILKGCGRPRWPNTNLVSFFFFLRVEGDRQTSSFASSSFSSLTSFFLQLQEIDMVKGVCPVFFFFWGGGRWRSIVHLSRLSSSVTVI